MFTRPSRSLRLRSESESFCTPGLGDMKGAYVMGMAVCLAGSWRCSLCFLQVQSFAHFEYTQKSIGIEQ